MPNWKLFVLMALLVSCKPQGTPLSSKDLHIYSFGTYIPGQLVKNFEQRFGLKVQISEYDNNEALVQGLTAQPATYDLIIPGDYTVDRLIKANKLQPLDLSQIPNYKNLDPAFLAPYFDPGGLTAGRGALQKKTPKYSLPYQWGTTGLVYDKSKVGSPVTGWADLWRPEFKGRIVVLDDPRELLGSSLLSLGFLKNSTNPQQLEAAAARLRQLAPAILAYDSKTPEKYLVSGEAWVGLMFNGNAALAQKANPNLEYVFPKEGAGIWFDNLAIPVDAPHPDAALAFINFALEPEQSILITQQYPYSNPNRAAIDLLKQKDPTLYKTYSESPVTNPSPLLLNEAKPVQNVGGFSETYVNLWNSIKEQK